MAGMQLGMAPIKTRMRLVAAGMLVGLAGFVGVELVDPELAPLAEHRGLCALVAALAGVAAVMVVHRRWPERLPAWMVGSAGGGAESAGAGSGR